MLHISKIKSLPYPDILTTDTIKNDHLRKELESIPDIVGNIRDKKIEDLLMIFRKAIDRTFEMEDRILNKHLFKAVEEVNDDLIKNNKPYRVDFRDEACSFFINETKTYWEKHGFDNDDGTLNHFRLGRYMETLDLIIRRYTDDDPELILYPKKIKRNRFSHLIFVTVVFNLINIIIFSLIHIVTIFFNLTKTSVFIYPIARDNYFICSHLYIP